MKLSRWSMIFTFSLLSVSIITYLTQILLFHDARNTFFYMLQDFAFVPIQVLLVTLIIDELLRRREKQELQNKLNMVIGAFYSDMGTHLVKELSLVDAHSDYLRSVFSFGADWTDKHFANAQRQVCQHQYAIACQSSDLLNIRAFLLEKRSFLLALLANPNLLEHESFTDLLWSICHLTEELDARIDLTNLPKDDLTHLAGDIQRAYRLLLFEWLAYVKHLRNEYPYIYSLVMRTHPFLAKASPVIN
ncbi:MAG TPA: hypothetical protein VHV83_06080 [Armatimonadota bacterium]|nr:hypothetical protein [Armatimonadota bacterium]